MPPKKKPAPTPLPPQPSPGPNPADPGNPNAPANPVVAPTAGFHPAGTVTNPQTGDLIDYPTVDVSAGNVSTTVTLGQNVKPTDKLLSDASLARPKGSGQARSTGEPAYSTVQDEINSIQSWYGNATIRQNYINQMYAAGLLSSKKNPSATDVIRAWSLLVQEASIRGDVSPSDLLSQASKGGWNALNPTLTTADFGGANSTGNPNNVPDGSVSTSETVYKSYLDPATVMGAADDAFYRLVGRKPNATEYQAFLNMVYGYQGEQNTGKVETQTTNPSAKVTIDPTTGQPVGPQGTSDGSTDPTKATSIVSQRGIGTRGLEFLAGQAALANPDEPNYQASTTYLNAFIKSLQGTAAGMQSSGPTTTVP